MKELIAAIDQGTTSTRFMVFDSGGREIAKSQLEHRQIMPRPGWVEHDPLEILDCARAVIAGAMQKKKLKFNQLSGIGITNQRETTVIWNPKTGQPWYNAIMETTALGAAYAAGLATGFWNGLHDLEKNWKAERSWTPRWSADRRESGYAHWKKAVERTLNWIETS